MRILVVGDSCKDVFVYCKVNRLCPDVPVPILIASETNESGGMSKNVQRNIQGLHQNCDLITNDNWEDITKTRYVHKESNHMFFRLDNEIVPNRVDISRIKYDYDAVVISDYNKGFLSFDDIEEICRNHPTVFIDTKKILGKWAENAKFIKINNTEYSHSLPYLTPILNDKIIHTMGSKGAEYREKLYPVSPVDVKDSSGAGDTFMAGLVVKYLENRDIDDAIVFANECAREVVKHKGVVSI
jgi:D-beta-D-heptose 7-phosphate kinase/D-beta-D-heptose 1-phosphate adenosyltransferase